MLNVWIGNLGKYNEGELIGEWLELPVSKKELNTFLKEKVGLQLTQAEVEKALAKDGVCYEEYMINDYETDLPIRVSEYSNLMMLNLLAMSSERVNNMEAVEAYIEYQGIDDIEEIIKAFEVAKNVKGKPTCIIAKTIKGKGVSFMENQVGWHGKAPNEEQYRQAMEELSKNA